MYREIKSKLPFIICATIFIIIIFSSITKADNDIIERELEQLAKQEIKIEKLTQPLYRIYKILDFFKNDSNEINLDGLFGLRIAQGAFIRLSDFDLASFNDTFNHKLKLAINIIKKRMELLGDQVVKHVKKRNGKYYKSFSPLVDSPYMNSVGKMHTRKLNQFYDDRTNLEYQFNEKFSDYCLGLLMEDLNNKKCATDNKCFSYFLIDNSSEYFLTHQLLYFMIANHIGCSTKVLNDLKNYSQDEIDSNQKFSTQIEQNENIDVLEDKLYSYYCSKIFHEVSKTYKDFDGDVRYFQTDLFIEQNLLCGMLKINEFHNEKSAEFIGKFQNSNGCYGGDIGANGPLINSKKIFVEMLDEINDSLILDNQMSAVSHLSKKKIHRHQHHRFKRNDMRMKNMCSSHESGLAIGYFSIFFEQALKELT